jgi:hypothetical protein
LDLPFIIQDTNQDQPSEERTKPGRVSNAKLPGAQGGTSFQHINVITYQRSSPERGVLRLFIVVYLVGAIDQTGHVIEPNLELLHLLSN